MELVPLTKENLQEVHSLHNRNIVRDQLDEETFCYKTLGDPDFDPDLALVAMEGSRIAGYLMSVCRPVEDGINAGIKMFAVDPEYRGKGIASGMIEQVEEIAKERGAKSIVAGFTRPNYLTAGFDPMYTPATALLIRRGYVKRGDAFNMDVDLSSSDWSTEDLERKLKPDGIICRRIGPENLDALKEYFRREGTSAGWQYQILRGAELYPPRIFVAEQNGVVIGFSAFDGVRPGWFGPMGTSEVARGKGIGTLTYLKCLQDLKALGYKTAVINAVGPLYFYSKISGAVVSRIFWMMTKELV